MRGDVYRLRAPKGARGHEQRGARYGVVLQADDLQALSTWLVAPTSTSARAATFRPAIEIDSTPTRVLVEQTSAVDPSRLGEQVGHLGFDELGAISAALRLVMSLGTAASSAPSAMPGRPEIVCLCGSMRFVEEMRAASRELTFAGAIVLAPAELGEQITEGQLASLGALHLRKIHIADRVVVVNPGGYIGESTRSEIAHARAAGKPVSYTHPARP